MTGTAVELQQQLLVLCTTSAIITVNPRQLSEDGSSRDQRLLPGIISDRSTHY